MKRSVGIVLAFLALGILVGCGTKNTTPSNYLNQEQEDAFKYALSRYLVDLPKHTDHTTKFDSAHNAYYLKQAKKLILSKYYTDKSGVVFFEIQRLAPSFSIKHVATGGKLKLDESGQIASLNLIYRTWKMEQEELNTKTTLLFDKMLNGESLEQYYTVNSPNNLYIEFPDEKVKFDTLNRVWLVN